MFSFLYTIHNTLSEIYAATCVCVMSVSALDNTCIAEMSILFIYFHSSLLKILFANSQRCDECNVMPNFRLLPCISKIGQLYEALYRFKKKKCLLKRCTIYNIY